MNAARRLLLVGALLLPLGVGTAFAHATLEASEPAPRSTTSEPPGQIRLQFAEAVELDFSRIEVHVLEADGVDTSAEDAWQRLSGLAAPRVTAALDDGADDRRVPAELVTRGRADEVVLTLPDELGPGVYVVLWRVLAIDGHATEDFLLFEVAPPTAP